MADNHEVKYEATMSRDQWRQTFIRCQITEPTHRATMQWLARACEETFDVAEVTVKVADGTIKAKPFADGKGSERVTLTLSRGAVQGIKFAAISDILGAGRGGKPASMLSRSQILDSLRDVGPGGTLLRLVTKESELPESKDLDEDELDLEPKKAEEVKAEAKA